MYRSFRFLQPSSGVRLLAGQCNFDKWLGTVTGVRFLAGNDAKVIRQPDISLTCCARHSAIELADNPTLSVRSMLRQRYVKTGSLPRLALH